MKRKHLTKIATGAGLSLALAACGSSASASSSASTSASVNWSSVSSVQAGGGMSALIAAAKKEGHLNVITLPPGWANYGAIMKAFQQKYGITITDAIPDGSSAQELAAIKAEQGTSKAPDVVDVGPSFALLGASDGLFAPYKVQEWSQIPSNAKAQNGDWFFDYGGYESIGYNADVYGKNPPTSFADLLQPQYKGAVALDGNPTSAGAAFGAVYAAAIANGGSLSNIQPGLNYFHKLAQVGNYVPVGSSPAVIESGQIKVAIDWDYLNVAAGKAVAGKVNWKVVVPSQGKYASDYVQAISKTAPDPAAARLWEEFLYSNTGQNLWLEGYARPILLNSMIKDGTVNKSALSAVPPVSGNANFADTSQLTEAQKLVASQWPNLVK